MLRTKHLRALFTTLLFLLMAAQSYADIHRWIGAAQDTKTIQDITIAGTWADTNTASITCNNKKVMVTLGPLAVATTDVATALANAINATGIENLNSDETRYNGTGGYAYGEFKDTVATVSGSVITLTSAKAGIDFVVTVAKTGSGTITLETKTQTATGKNWWNNVDNWVSTGGGIPSDDDDVLFDHGSIDVLYGSNTATDLIVKVTNDYQGEWGLSATNQTWTANPYSEYRDLKLDLPTTFPAGGYTITIGDLNSTIPPVFRLRFDLGTIDGAVQIVQINDAPAFSTSQGAAIEIAGGKNLLLKVENGSVILGPIATENIPTLVQTIVRGDKAHVTITDNCVLHSGMSPIYVYGGELRYNPGAGFATDFVISGGTSYITCTDAWDDLTLKGGTVYATRGGADLEVYGGGKFIIPDGISITITNTTLYRGFYYEDNSGLTFPTNGFITPGCQLSDGTFITGDGLKAVLSTP